MSNYDLNKCFFAETEKTVRFTAGLIRR